MVPIVFWIVIISVMIILVVGFISFKQKERFNDTLFATLYEDCNFSTKANYSLLSIGDYSTIKAMGLNGAHLSSIKVPLGLKVTLYEFENFEGRNTVITSDAICLLNNPMVIQNNPSNAIKTWNDKTYSIKVQSN
jgi:hypothetical protein